MNLLYIFGTTQTVIESELVLRSINVTSNHIDDIFALIAWLNEKDLLQSFDKAIVSNENFRKRIEENISMGISAAFMIALRDLNSITSEPKVFSETSDEIPKTPAAEQLESKTQVDGSKFNYVKFFGEECLFSELESRQPFHKSKDFFSHIVFMAYYHSIDGLDEELVVNSVDSWVNFQGVRCVFSKTLMTWKFFPQNSSGHIVPIEIYINRKEQKIEVNTMCESSEKEFFYRKFCAIRDCIHNPDLIGHKSLIKPAEQKSPIFTKRLFEESDEKCAKLTNTIISDSTLKRSRTTYCDYCGTFREIDDEVAQSSSGAIDEVQIIPKRHRSSPLREKTKQDIEIPKPPQKLRK